jgi:hypothetical protein
MHIGIFTSSSLTNFIDEGFKVALLVVLVLTLEDDDSSLLVGLLTNRPLE